jgi:hypothetical protein
MKYDIGLLYIYILIYLIIYIECKHIMRCFFLRSVLTCPAESKMPMVYLLPATATVPENTKKYG